jgi:K+-sensing histidine kinase KdpD
MGRCRLDTPMDLDTAGNWDPQLLERVVGNLLSNAAKYSDPSSVIEVSARDGEGAIRLTVRDGGLALAFDELPQLFHRCGRTQGARADGANGAGLGLVCFCRG